MNTISKIQRAGFKYKKSKNICEFFNIQNPETLQKAGQFALRFYILKTRLSLIFSIFHGIFKICIYIQKA